VFFSAFQLVVDMFGFAATIRQGDSPRKGELASMPPSPSTTGVEGSTEIAPQQAAGLAMVADPLATTTATPAPRNDSGLSWVLSAVSATLGVREPSDDVDDFVYVLPTGLTLVRALAHKHPHCACAVLLLSFAVLVSGELATSAWWAYSLGFCGLPLMSIVLAMLLGAARFIVDVKQFQSSGIALMLNMVRALPAYTAIMLLSPPLASRDAQSIHSAAGGSHQASGTSDQNMPRLVAVTVVYLSSALVPWARKEWQHGRSSAGLERALIEARTLARSIFVLCAWSFTAVVLHVGVRQVLAKLIAPPFSVMGVAAVSPIASCWILVLALHILGLACAEWRRRLEAALVEEALPLLFGEERGEPLTLEKLMTVAWQRRAQLLSSCVPCVGFYIPKRAVVVASIMVMGWVTQALLPSRFFAGRFNILVAFAMVVILFVYVAKPALGVLLDSRIGMLRSLLPKDVLPALQHMSNRSWIKVNSLTGIGGKMGGLREKVQ